jgi:hypothetical protein
MSRVKSLKWMKPKDEKANWSITKSLGPDTGSYDNDVSKDKCSPKAPGYHFGKGNRNFFTKVAEKRSLEGPGAGAYNTINDSKVHKLGGNKRSH